MKLIHLATEHCPNDLLNLGSGVGHTIREYDAMICEIVDYDPAKILYDTDKWSGVPKKVFNPGKIKRLFNFFFFIRFICSCLSRCNFFYRRS